MLRGFRVKGGGRKNCSQADSYPRLVILFQSDYSDLNIFLNAPYITYVIAKRSMSSLLSTKNEEENRQASEEKAAIDAELVERLKSWCYL